MCISFILCTTTLCTVCFLINVLSGLVKSLCLATTSSHCLSYCLGVINLSFSCNHFFGRQEGNVLFNNALNTFYLWLYVVKHMVKDHSDSKRVNPLPPHRLLFLFSSKVFFICIIPDRITHTTFVIPVVEHWLE